VAIAFPFVEVFIDTKALQPTAQRAPGVLAVVGSTGGAGTAPANRAIDVKSLSDAVAPFNDLDADNQPDPETTLYRALRAVFLQNPAPVKIYAIKTQDDDWAAGLAALDAVDDVTFVALAGASVKLGAETNAPIAALNKHCADRSGEGNKRIGVAHVDTAIVRSDTYADDVIAKATPLKSGVSRMVMVAARGAVDGDGAAAEVAAAAASAIAGQPPATSIALKKIVGFSMPLASQYSPGEIGKLSADGIIPIIDPSLIAGESLHFADGTCYTTDAALKYIDIVRLLDDVEFKLKASLVGMIADARITRTGLAAVIRRAEGVLDRVRSAGAIDRFLISIPTYDALLKPEAARTAGEADLIAETRSERLVGMTIVIWIGPAIHRLVVQLQPKF
jgi:hypothetical protein